MKDYLQQWNSSKLQFFKKFEKDTILVIFASTKEGRGVRTWPIKPETLGRKSFLSKI